MRKYLGLIVLAGAAAILAGIYFSLSQSTDPAQTGQLYQFSPGEGLNEISVTNQYGSFTFAHENDKWVMTKPDRYRVNQEKIKIMADFLLDLPINRALDSDLPEYGFTKPNITIKFVSTSNQVHSFYIGNMTPSKAQVYLKDAQTGKIYVCDIGPVAQLDGSLTAFRDKDIFTIDKTQITRLVYYEGTQKQLDVERSASQDWQMTYPYTAPARSVELNEITGKMLSWSVAGYPEEGPLDLAAVGLDSPSHVLEVSDASGQSQRFEFGKSEEGMIYVRSGEKNDVVKLFSVDIDFTKFSPDKLLFVLPLRTTIDQVTHIRLDANNQSTTLDINHSLNPPQISLSGSEIPYSEFITFFIKYIDLSADGYDPAGKAGALNMVLTTSYVDGSTRELKLYDRDENSVFMELNGKTQFFMSKEQIKQLLYCLDVALAAKK